MNVDNEGGASGQPHPGGSRGESPTPSRSVSADRRSNKSRRSADTSPRSAAGAAANSAERSLTEEAIEHAGAERASLGDRVREILIGKPRDLSDRAVFHHVTLVAFLAWVGLGADGLSSSSYGPPEAFANLGPHRYLAVFLAAAIVGTVFIISACYSHIIEEFPSGGGYLVASKLLGPRIGVVSGCALVVDYVLTVTVSIAAAGDALFGLLPPGLADWKMPTELAAIVFLVILNLRGVKESIQILLPIFIVFLVTHVVLILGAISLHFGETRLVAGELSSQFRQDLHNPAFGLLGMIALLMYAYSLGAGTYTGIEAVSNSMPVMREPRVATAKRTMVYMAFSLAFMAGGLIIAYLLLGIAPDEQGHMTMNQILSVRFAEEIGLRGWTAPAFVWTTLLSEAMLLVVAAQAGFIGGPRVLANMAQDSWVPNWFANLSERLSTQNGILLMGGSAVAALLYTGGDISVLVIMYSINVFVTFSLSMVGMCRHWWQRRGQPLWRRRLALFVLGAALCVTILVVTVVEKFQEGAWRTLAVTGVCVGMAFLIRRHYFHVGTQLRRLDNMLDQLSFSGVPSRSQPDPAQAVAAILVGRYSGLGVHTMLNAIRFAPEHFKGFVFISVGVVDSGNFKGVEEVESLREHTQATLDRYVELGQRLGMPSSSLLRVGTDAVDELEELCLEVARKYPKATFFAGQLAFEKDNMLQHLLHNQTAYALQRRLHWAGLPMVILPVRVR
jgi:amino acid transporter